MINTDGSAAELLFWTIWRRISHDPRLFWDRRRRLKDPEKKQIFQRTRWENPGICAVEVLLETLLNTFLILPVPKNTSSWWSSSTETCTEAPNHREIQIGRTCKFDPMNMQIDSSYICIQELDTLSFGNIQEIKEREKKKKRAGVPTQENKSMTVWCHDTVTTLKFITSQ